MSQLAISASFEYLWSGSAAIIYFFSPFSAGAVFRRQNLMSDSVAYKDGPRAERVTLFIFEQFVLA